MFNRLLFVPNVVNKKRLTAATVLCSLTQLNFDIGRSYIKLGRPTYKTDGTPYIPIQSAGSLWWI